LYSDCDDLSHLLRNERRRYHYTKSRVGTMSNQGISRVAEPDRRNEAIPVVGCRENPGPASTSGLWSTPCGRGTSVTTRTVITAAA